MTSDLSQAHVEVGDVVRVERLGALVEITVALPHLASTVRPGQFAQLRCGDGVVPLLRRPFSVAWVDGDECAFVFEEVGIGTRLLGSLRSGDTLDVLGPLGRGFTIGNGGRAVIVSGGVGCAPFPILIGALAVAGVVDVTVLSGASTVARLYPASRFRRGRNIEVREITEDGTAGDRGLVTDLLDVALDGASTSLYACGPNQMLAAVWDRAHAILDTGAIAEASMEAPMGCGYGTCLGCALPTRTQDAEPRWALCCTDGPVMAMRDIDWDGVRALPGADVA
ncbi:MAG: hypothetical protein JOY80_05320 [Candidatus Dormibacteraeota bacterium]|nr:hypothetical protein [Candidatus Dormibacteraeota bacterium]